MRSRIHRRAGRGPAAVAAALTAAVLAGCSSDSAPEPTPPPSDGDTSGGDTSGGDAGDDGPVRPASAAGSVGEEGSACPLPVVFDLAEDWSPAAVDFEIEMRQGPVTMACEIDAKPAGQIGFLRVWTGDPEQAEPTGPDGAREVLEAFLAEERDATEPEYLDIEAGGFPAAEVVYVQGSSVDEPRTQRALAVVAPDGAVLLHLGGLDDQEHQEMLPAYELAKASLRAR